MKSVLDALYVLGGKWKLPVILSLIDGPKRFNEIQHEVYPTTPVTIIYEATDHSAALRKVLNELSLWGEQHREKIRSSMRK
jgi:DNA-binding HxlR family transcriptional regulator